MAELDQAINDEFSAERAVTEALKDVRMAQERHRIACIRWTEAITKTMELRIRQQLADSVTQEGTK